MASPQPAEAPAPPGSKPPADDPSKQAPPAAEKPKPEPTVPKKDLDALQSNLQGKVAAAQRGEATAKRESGEATSRLAEAQSHIKLLTEQGEIGGDEAARLERLAGRETSGVERMTEALKIEKTLTARVLSLEHGVPETDLLVHDDPKDMKIAALEWERTHRDDEPAPGAPAGEKPPAAAPASGKLPAGSPREPAAPPGDFDLGDGGGSGKSITEMDPKEFVEYRAKLRRSHYQRHGYGS